MEIDNPTTTAPENLGKGARGKTLYSFLLFYFLGVFTSALLLKYFSHIITIERILTFSLSAVGFIISLDPTTATALLLSSLFGSYTIFQEYREHKRHGSITPPKSNSLHITRKQ